LHVLRLLLLFKEPRRSDGGTDVSLAQAAKNSVTVISNPRFMIPPDLSGSWIVTGRNSSFFRSTFSDYINPKPIPNKSWSLPPNGNFAANAGQLLTQRIPAFSAITLGTLISGLAWSFDSFIRPSRWRSSRCYGFTWRDHAVPALLRYNFAARARLAAGHVYGFAFLPIGIGSLIGGCLAACHPSLRRGHHQPAAFGAP